MKINRVVVTLVIALGYAVALPRLPWLTERAFAATFVLVAALGLWAWTERAWADVGLAAAVAAALAGAKLIFSQLDDLLLVLVTAAISAFGLLNATLLIGPWSRFFRRRFIRLLKHRRHVGVTSLLCALVHVNIVLAAYYNNQLTAALQAGANVFGAIALYLMELLGLTSWRWTQRQISPRWWNVIHAGSLVPYLALVGYAWTRSPTVLQPWEKFTIAVIVGYWLLLTPTVASRWLGKSVNGWKQLHRLAYAAYAAAVIHVWTGVVARQPLMVQSFFWTPVALVIGTHAVGLVMKYRQQRARQVAQPPAVSLPTSRPTQAANGNA